MNVGDPEIDTFYKCLMLCISACKCPTCGAQADVPCTTRSKKPTGTHVSRSKAGHALIQTPVDVMHSRAVKHFVGP